MSLAQKLKDNDQARGQAAERMKAICNAAEKEGRQLSAEERQNWDAANSDYDRLGDESASIKADLERQAKSHAAAEAAKASTRRTDAAAGGKVIEFKDSTAAAKRSGINNFLVKGAQYMTPDERAALQVDQDSIGGTLVPDEQFTTNLIKFVDDFVFIRQLATVIPLTSADSLGAPSWDTDPDDADWTSELGTGSADSAARTGKRVLKPEPLAKRILVSKTLLRKSALPIEPLITERLGYKFAITEEKAFLTGSGANQPLGLFTAHASGISTARDVSSGNNTTEVKADGLINAKFSLKAQYMASPSLRWLFNRTVVRDIRKLKDGNSQYLWTMGLAGAPDTILEVPYLMSEFVPNTMTSGQYVGMIGDFRHYWIVEALRMELQRLDELYAATNQVGFIGRMEIDGAPVLEEAFARVTLA